MKLMKLLLVVFIVLIGTCVTHADEGCSLLLDGKSHLAVDRFVGGNVAKTVNFNESLTIEAWIMPSSNSSHDSGSILQTGRILSNSPRSYMIRYDYKRHSIIVHLWEQRVDLTWDMYTITSHVIVHPDVWTHIAFVTNSWKVTINYGLSSDVIDFVPTHEEPPKFFAVGTNFTGAVDDVRVWNKSLSSDELGQLYKVGVCPSSTVDLGALVLFLSFDDCGNNVTVDVSQSHACGRMVLNKNDSAKSYKREEKERKHNYNNNWGGHKFQRSRHHQYSENDTSSSSNNKKHPIPFVLFFGDHPDDHQVWQSWKSWYHHDNNNTEASTNNNDSNNNSNDDASSPSSPAPTTESNPDDSNPNPSDTGYRHRYGGRRCGRHATITDFKYGPSVPGVQSCWIEPPNAAVQCPYRTRHTHTHTPSDSSSSSDESSYSSDNDSDDYSSSDSQNKTDNGNHSLDVTGNSTLIPGINPGAGLSFADVLGFPTFGLLGMFAFFVVLFSAYKCVRKFMKAKKGKKPIEQAGMLEGEDGDLDLEGYPSAFYPLSSSPRHTHPPSRFEQSYFDLQQQQQQSQPSQVPQEQQQQQQPQPPTAQPPTLSQPTTISQPPSVVPPNNTQQYYMYYMPQMQPQGFFRATPQHQTGDNE